MVHLISYPYVLGWECYVLLVKCTWEVNLPCRLFGRFDGHNHYTFHWYPILSILSYFKGDETKHGLQIA